MNLYKLLPLAFILILRSAHASPTISTNGELNNGDFKQRVESKIDFIKNNVSFPFRRFYWVKLMNKKEPNAYSVGTHIVVTKSLLKAVNERELLAVVAHEMAHREKHHLFSRLGMFVGGAVAALLDFESDDSYGQRYAGFNEDVSLRQELQADCLAYNWLLELKNRGYNADPSDLNKATTKIIGIDFGSVDPTYFYDNPGWIRFMRIKDGHGPNCDF